MMAAPPDPALTGWQPLDSHTFMGTLGTLWRRAGRGDSPYEYGLIPGPHCVNRHGRVHGGVIATFADYVGGLPLLELAPDQGNVTVNLDVNYVNSAVAGTFLIGTSRIVSRKTSLAFLHGEITCDGATIATFASIMKRIRPGSTRAMLREGVPTAP